MEIFRNERGFQLRIKVVDPFALGQTFLLVTLTNECLQHMAALHRLLLSQGLYNVITTIDYDKCAIESDDNVVVGVIAHCFIGKNCIVWHFFNDGQKYETEAVAIDDLPAIPSGGHWTCKCESDFIHPRNNDDTFCFRCCTSCDDAVDLSFVAQEVM